MEPKLFTPGPLTTSRSVKEAMLVDLGSREPEFTDVVAVVRDELLALAGSSTRDGHEAVIVQGSGTFAIEALLSSAIPSSGRLLVIENGVYGARMLRIAEIHGIPTASLRCPSTRTPDLAALERLLAEADSITHVAVVHCETTSGILNPVDEIGEIVAAAGRRYLIDAMSSFGAVPLTFPSSGAAAIVSSSNKCIQGVPGFAFVLLTRELLDECEGRARTLTLDLHAQWKGLAANGQFRFTPPTHVLLAFARALEELAAEGGVSARNARYSALQARIATGMKELGFEAIVPTEHQSPILTTFREPESERYSFELFHAALKTRGCAIYPGKLEDTRAFRIGSVGDLTQEDAETLLRAVAQVCAELGIDRPQR